MLLFVSLSKGKQPSAQSRQQLGSGSIELFGVFLVLAFGLQLSSDTRSLMMNTTKLPLLEDWARSRKWFAFAPKLSNHDEEVRFGFLCLLLHWLVTTWKALCQLAVANVTFLSEEGYEPASDTDLP